MEAVRTGRDRIEYTVPMEVAALCLEFDERIKRGEEGIPITSCETLRRAVAAALESRKKS